MKLLNPKFIFHSRKILVKRIDIWLTSNGRIL